MLLAGLVSAHQYDKDLKGSMFKKLCTKENGKLKLSQGVRKRNEIRSGENKTDEGGSVNVQGKETRSD